MTNFFSVKPYCILPGNWWIDGTLCSVRNTLHKPNELGKVKTKTFQLSEWIFRSHGIMELSTSSTVVVELYLHAIPLSRSHFKLEILLTLTESLGAAIVRHR